MTVGDFVARLKKVKAYLADNPEASDELKASFEGDAAAFRKAYDTEAVKKALAGGEPIASDLEERITSTVILMNKDRLQRGTG